MSSKKRETSAKTILYVHADSGPYGSSVMLYELASRLPRERYRPLVALPEEGPIVDALRKAGVEVVIFPLGELRRNFRPDRLAAMLLQQASGPRRLAALIRRENVAIVQTVCAHVVTGAIAAKMTRRLHISQIQENFLPPKALFAAIARLLWATSHRVVAVSHGTAEEFFGDRAGDPKLRIIHHAVDPAEFRTDISPAQGRRALGWPEENLHVGILGRFTPWKGHEVFLRAAALVAKDFPQVRFAIVGDSDTPRNVAYKNRLRALAQELGIMEKIRWTGFVSPVQPLIAALDLVVVPSVRPEPFGRVLVEAMAMERPVVATNHGGPVDILAEGGGILVPPSDAPAQAAAIARLIEDDKKRLAMGKVARAQVLKRFSIGAHVDAFVKLYDELLSEAG